MWKTFLRSNVVEVYICTGPKPSPVCIASLNNNVSHCGRVMRTIVDHLWNTKTSTNSAVLLRELAQCHGEKGEALCAGLDSTQTRPELFIGRTLCCQGWYIPKHDQWNTHCRDDKTQQLQKLQWPTEQHAYIHAPCVWICPSQDVFQ